MRGTLSQKHYNELSGGVITGAGLKALREAMKLSSANMAKAMGIRASTFFRWENRPPDTFAADSVTLVTDFVYNALEGGYISIK